MRVLILPCGKTYTAVTVEKTVYKNSVLANIVHATAVTSRNFIKSDLHLSLTDPAKVRLFVCRT